MDDPRLDHEFSTGRPILSAPRRRMRPLHTSPESDLGACPFCPGEEHQTPPEREAIREPGTAADQPGWRARAFPNLFPAAVWHEVIVEGEQHLTQPGDLPPDRLADAVDLWCRRIAAHEAEADVRVPFLFKNVGRFAGASVHHNHSQLLGLPFVPPRLELLLRRHRTHGCAVRHALAHADADGRVVHRSDHHVVLTPPTPRMPNELWLVPAAAGRAPDVLDAVHRIDLVDALGAAFRAIRDAFDGPAFNIWLNRIPGEARGLGDPFPWSFQMQPRTGFLAGLELGGDMTINAMPAAESAERYRRALAGDRASG
jgi:UDPglucose--hexose-1-phosphate uridylyltransferase